MKRAEGALERAAVKSWWMRAPQRKRNIGAAILIVEISVLFIVGGLLLDDAVAWIIAGFMWVSSVAFFTGLAINPVRTARVAVRAFFVFLVLAVLGWIAFVMALFLVR